jgi:hypothetical protein
METLLASLDDVFDIISSVVGRLVLKGEKGRVLR